MRWIKEGLKFECQPDCGRCCTHSVFGDGDLEGVFLTKRDRRRLERAGLAYAIERRDSWYVLAERDGTCVFLDEESKGCGIYEVRPTQCRNFPFGSGKDSPVATRAKWRAAKEGCPGIDVGRFYPKRAIRKLVRNRVEHGSFEV
jgi:Fe-S-cluster containining protein